jgi:hypothetical protein
MISARANKAQHRTAIPLRSIAAGKLGRYSFFEKIHVWVSNGIEK